MNLLLAVCVLAGMMNARIRFEESSSVRQSGRSICLAAEVIQTSGDFLVIEPGELCALQPSCPEGKIFSPEGSLSGCAVVNMKELAWEFTLAEAGEYEIWLRAFFPLAACYNHVEQMDDGERQRFVDSVDAAKIDKYAALPGDDQMRDKWLEPKIWHWFLNSTYQLSAGRHRLWFPPSGAWCGGCLLDRIVLVKKGSSVKAASATKDNRRVVRAQSGSVVSRRIKTERIAKWIFEADTDAGDGAVALEYSYGGEKWHKFDSGELHTVPDKSDYLYIRIAISAAESGVQPVVYNYRFKVEKRAK